MVVGCSKGERSAPGWKAYLNGDRFAQELVEKATIYWRSLTMVGNWRVEFSCYGAGRCGQQGDALGERALPRTVSRVEKLLFKIGVPGQVVTPSMSNSEIQPDPAAVFAAACSLSEACYKRAKNERILNLSVAYHGLDQFMREVMRVGLLFETWACEHVDFDQTNEVWPYMLEDKFGEACLHMFGAAELAKFGTDDSLRVALRLGLPIKVSGTPEGGDSRLN
jgi:hypothetical protein